jgi:hypothetical protein
MPAIRVESRPFTVDATTTGLTFGPWPHDVLIRSMNWLWNYSTQAATRRQRVFASMNASQAMLDVSEAGDWAWDADGSARAGQGAAFPGATTTPRIKVDGVGQITSLDGTGLWIHLAIPYNLIIPQRGIFGVFIDNAQTGDTLSNAILTLEYGATRPALPKEEGRGPRSSKNNP